MSFSEFILGEVCDVGSSKRIYAKEYCETGIPFYRSKEVIQKARNESITDELYISEEKYVELDHKFGSPKYGDILLASIGANLGISYFVNSNDKFYFKDGNVTWFRNFNEKVNSKYIYYWLNSRDGQNKLLNSAIGSAQKALTIDGLKKLKFQAPLFEEQKAIAETLSCLDDKIELNSHINKTLEEMAQAIFKSWFVDFEPFQDGEFEDSELGMIPKGWKVGKLEDVLVEIEAGNRPKGGVGDLDTGIPSIGAENIIGLGKYDFSKEKYVTQEYFESMNKGIVKNWDVLLYKDGAQLGRKTMFSQGFPHKKCCVNSHVFILRCNDLITQPFLYFWLDQDDMTQNIINLNTNSAQPGINQPSVKQLKILIPDKETITRFQNTVENLLVELFKNCNENKILTAIRDTLLPKLISGEISVPIKAVQ